MSLTAGKEDRAEKATRGRCTDDSGTLTSMAWMDSFARSLTGRPYVGSYDILATEDLLNASEIEGSMERWDWRSCRKRRSGVLYRGKIVDESWMKKRRPHPTEGKRQLTRRGKEGKEDATLPPSQSIGERVEEGVGQCGDTARC